MMGKMKQLKYKLSRSVLETYYKSFILSIIEYGSLVYDNAPDSLLDKLESVHNEAARIITGTKFRTSHKDVRAELGWTTLKKRRLTNKLILLYKILHTKEPSYLYDIIPKRINVRDARLGNILRIPKCKSEHHRRTFLPSACIEWNKLDMTTRSAPTIMAFRNMLIKQNEMKPIINKYYALGQRRVNITLTQIRRGCSNLNYDKFCMYLTDNPMCENCGAHAETSVHFFLECVSYNEFRNEMMQKLHTIEGVNHINIELITSGNITLSDEINKQINEAVMMYISHTKRF